MHPQKILIFLLLALDLGIGRPKLFAQEKPVFFPEDISSKTLKLKCYCTPGVNNKSRSRGLEIAYHHIGSSQVGEEEIYPLSAPLTQINSLRNLIFKIRAPLINRAGSKLIVGFFYRPEKYTFKSIGVDYKTIFHYLDDLRLKSSGIEAIYTKSFNEKHYLSLLFRNIYNGDYPGAIKFSKQYAIYNVAALFGIKKTDMLEWGIGINYSKSFRTTMVLPFLLYNRTFSTHWGLETVLPAMVTLRYNASTKSILLASVRYNSRSYAIEVPDYPSEQFFNLNHSELRISLTLEQRIRPWIWADLTLGFQDNFNTEFMAKINPDASFQVEPVNAPYLKIGLFLSPPNRFMK